jgi:NADPH:quinone reductase-like Zn-dependent oxidoreductase
MRISHSWVQASSINPIDLRICEGYGREMLPLQAKMGLNEGGIPDPRRVVAALTTSLDTNERFPLVPGRDCSAEVVEVGSRVQGIEIGDQVRSVLIIGKRRNRQI